MDKARFGPILGEIYAIAFDCLIFDASEVIPDKIEMTKWNTKEYRTNGDSRTRG